MALPSSGPLSINDINSLFGRGNNLNAYRGTSYYFPGNINQYFFSSGTISISDFYNTQPNNPVTPGSQSFTSAGLTSFTVPLFNSMTVEVWGGGGSGGEAYNGNTISQGGQGGSYVKYSISPGQLTVGSSQSVYVGAGGAGVQNNGGAGNPGTYSYFADAVWAIGGYGGRGQFAGATSASSYTPTVSVPWTLVTSEAGGNGGYGGPGSSVTYAGGGGGGGQNTAGVTQAGGSSTYGGAGGVGNGGWLGQNPYQKNGYDPAGGGGGLVYQNASGSGGTGKVLITWT
jgi:hypothetical protein